MTLKVGHLYNTYSGNMAVHITSMDQIHQTFNGDVHQLEADGTIDLTVDCTLLYEMYGSFITHIAGAPRRPTHPYYSTPGKGLTLDLTTERPFVVPALPPPAGTWVAPTPAGVTPHARSTPLTGMAISMGMTAMEEAPYWLPVVKCECGADKVKEDDEDAFVKHYDWCPKYKAWEGLK